MIARPAAWSDGRDFERPLVWISYAFGTLPSAIATALVTGLLLTKKPGGFETYRFG